MLEVGTEITRHDGQKFRLTGVIDGTWVAAPLDAFGPSERLSAADLVQRFAEVSDPSVPRSDDGNAALRDADARATAEDARALGRARREPAANDAEAVRKVLGEDARSPEEVFQAL